MRKEGRYFVRVTLWEGGKNGAGQGVLGLQGAHKLLIFKAFFVVVYFAGVPLALLVPLLTGVICGLRMERVGRRWGTAIGAAVGIPASALALS